MGEPPLPLCKILCPIADRGTNPPMATLALHPRGSPAPGPKFCSIPPPPPPPLRVQRPTMHQAAQS